MVSRERIQRKEGRTEKPCSGSNELQNLIQLMKVVQNSKYYDLLSDLKAVIEKLKQDPSFKSLEENR